MGKLELILIGYWHSHLEPHFPDPAWFIDPEWDVVERGQVIAYLKAGQPMPYASMGLSWCRFRCGINNLGSGEFSDGKYVWPEGLVHYLEAHQLRLPEVVVADFLGASHSDQELNLTNAVINDEWWRAQKGWNSLGKSFLDELDWGIVTIEQKDPSFKQQQEKLLVGFLGNSYGVKKGLASIEAIVAGQKMDIKGRFVDYAGFAKKAVEIGLESSFVELGLDAFFDRMS